MQPNKYTIPENQGGTYWAKGGGVGNKILTCAVVHFLLALEWNCKVNKVNLKTVLFLFSAHKRMTENYKI